LQKTGRGTVTKFPEPPVKKKEFARRNTIRVSKNETGNKESTGRKKKKEGQYSAKYKKGWKKNVSEPRQKRRRPNMKHLEKKEGETGG